MKIENKTGSTNNKLCVRARSALALTLASMNGVRQSILFDSSDCFKFIPF